jgi:hypothetical protein
VSELRYPYVECDAHPGEREPGYIVCPHVFEGGPIAHLERATEDNLGALSCAACYARRNDRDFVTNTFVLSCAAGLREKGLLASA